MSCKICNRSSCTESFHSLEGIRQGLGITREQCIEANIVKLAKRYEGMKYSDGAAQDRADKTA